SRRRHTRFSRDWSSDVCSSDLLPELDEGLQPGPVKRLAPAHQESPHALLGRVGPGVLELLLEYVGSEQVAVLRQEHREVPAFARSEERRVGNEGKSSGVARRGR